MASGRNVISIVATQAHSLDSLDTSGSALRLRRSNPDPPISTRLLRRELDEIVTIAIAWPILGEFVHLLLHEHHPASPCALPARHVARAAVEPLSPWMPGCVCSVRSAARSAA